MDEKAKRTGLGIAVALGVFLVLRFLDPFGREPTPANMEAAAMADPDFAVYLKAFKESFPTEYARFLTDTAADAKAGVPQDRAKANGFQRVNRLVASHRADLVRAPDAALMTHVKAEAAVLRGLDDAQCARLFMTGSASPDTEVTSANKRLFAEFTAATMRAERAGMDAPVNRPTAPSPADVMLVADGVRAQGLNTAQVQALAAGTLPSMSAADQCAVGRAMLGAVSAMKPADGARLWSQMLRSG